MEGKKEVEDACESTKVEWSKKEDMFVLQSPIVTTEVRKTVHDNTLSVHIDGIVSRLIVTSESVENTNLVYHNVEHFEASESSSTENSESSEAVLQEVEVVQEEKAAEAELQEVEIVEAVNEADDQIPLM
ncbi:hypothetical protein K7X08_033317 [Anisodus acutangulus]|uniref:Uncharacterized protein n=1 Tax=Anisodus acutangulus TaxID=402998 RepID=A0A9Q1M2F2_9SOLA|nr:hypothetical protein K7X08_033317 [Anisodus acutangulus]